MQTFHRARRAAPLRPRRALSLRAVALCAASISAAAAQAAAVNFAEPTAWTVGDLNSTRQQWVADPLNPFAATGTLPTAGAATPALGAVATMGVVRPGFVAGSGGYYSFGGNYGINALTPNHGGPAGIGGPYPLDYGTRVVIQTASTMNGADSVLTDSVQIVAPDGSELVGGCNSCMVQARELFVGDVETSIGIVPQQEISFEFWLPEHTGDFRVEFSVVAHSSFQHLRIDSHIAGPPPVDPDFDRNSIVDGFDFLAWQRCPPVYGGDEALAAWALNIGDSTAIPAASRAPEPASLSLVAVALLAGATRARTRTSR